MVRCNGYNGAMQVVPWYVARGTIRYDGAIQGVYAMVRYKVVRCKGYIR